MSKEEKSGASAEEQKQAKEVVHEFYELLPFLQVDKFDNENASEEELAEFKSLIDEAQNKFEQVESMRIPTGRDFTAGELTDTEVFPYRKLQKIAKQNGISAAQSRACLEGQLTGLPKSLSASGRYAGKMVERLSMARAKAGNYQHARQIAARQNR